MQQQDASYILLSKIFSKAFQYDTVFMKLKTSKSSNIHTTFLNGKEMINTLKFRVIKCKGRGFESSGMSRTLLINKQAN